MAESTTGVEVPAARRAWAVSLREWLGNPLLVAVVGTVLASLVIPSLTRQWQDHQKQLDIQTSLVGSMSSSVSDALVSGRMIASGVFATGVQGAYNDSFRAWQVQSSVDAARLAAYYPDVPIADDWREYATIVGNYLQLTTRVDGFRPGIVAQLRGYGALPRTTPAIRWAALARRNSGGAFLDSYIALSFALGERRDELVREVLARRPNGF